MINNCSNVDDFHLKAIIYELLSSNGSQWMDECGHHNHSSVKSFMETGVNDRVLWSDIGKNLYAFGTPVIAVIGLIDNLLSLTVFMSKFMRRLSSTCYLATLSLCHIVTLLTYVTWDWLHKGLVRWPGHMSLNLTSYPVGCHVFLYISYTFRFASVWLIVAFAVERYIVICHPHYRKVVCARRFAKKVTVATLVCAGLFSAYKPALSGVYESKNASIGSTLVCVGNPDFRQLNFLIDSLYVILITAVPLCVISAISIPIIRKLKPTRFSNNSARLVFKENRIRLELTVILLAISWCFILLTLPYFVTWCIQFSQSLQSNNIPIQGDFLFFFDDFSGKLAITRTVYYLNYATNFFLYCLTGSHYRRQVKSILRRRYRGFNLSLGVKTDDL